MTYYQYYTAAKEHMFWTVDKDVGEYILLSRYKTQQKLGLIDSEAIVYWLTCPRQHHILHILLQGWWQQSLMAKLKEKNCLYALKCFTRKDTSSKKDQSVLNDKFFLWRHTYFSRESIDFLVLHELVYQHPYFKLTTEKYLLRRNNEVCKLDFIH